MSIMSFILGAQFVIFLLTTARTIAYFSDQFLSGPLTTTHQKTTLQKPIYFNSQVTWLLGRAGSGREAV